MPLAAGDRFGPFEILDLIGKGGMGEVYRARDTRLKREVALKVLPDAFAHDAQRMARFQREAELLASLNHPNIAAIHGVEQNALVMELVEGEAPRGPMPLEEALRIARQIAEALEYAHERGVIHRDLKPANIKITPQGTVKLLDFGLAKAIEDPLLAADPANSPTHSPTLTMGATRAGVILGTAGYMSPEQARGKPADRRSDIWAFGVVLYELVCGKRAFQGETATDILASVMKEELPLDAVPAPIRPIVARCLRKDPRARWQSIGDVRMMLEEPAATPEPARRAATSPLWMGIAAAAAVLAGVGWWGWLKPRPAGPRPIARFATPIPEVKATPAGISVSRDGSLIAYRTGTPVRVYVRRLDEFEARPVPGTETDASPSAPCFSPDGASIAFSAGNGRQMRKIPLAGGAALTLVEGLNGADTCDWATDGYIYFGVANRIMRVPESGGKEEVVAAPDEKSGEISVEYPQLLPGGKQLLYSILTGQGFTSAQLAVVNLETKERTIVLQGAGYGEFAPTGPGASKGHLLYGQNGALFAAPFDLASLKAGAPGPVLNGVMGIGPVVIARASEAGTLAYLAGGAIDVGESTLSWFDRQGKEQPIPEEARRYAEPNLSPDGKRAAVSILDVQTFTVDLRVYETQGGRLTRLTFEGVNGPAVWMPPDGKNVIYAHAAALTARDVELRSVPSDNSRAPVTLAKFPEGQAGGPTSISPDGKTVIGDLGTIGSATRNLWALPLEDAAAGGKPEIRKLRDSTFNERHAVFSPDGRWIAYTSNSSGRDEVYVIPYPGPGGISQVSTGGGASPRWIGKEIFYLSGGKMMAVEVETAPTFRAGTLRVLFTAPLLATPTPGTQYDVTPDGRRFFMARLGTPAQDEAPELRVVLNWFEELRRLAPAK